MNKHLIRTITTRLWTLRSLDLPEPELEREVTKYLQTYAPSVQVKAYELGLVYREYWGWSWDQPTEKVIVAKTAVSQTLDFLEYLDRLRHAQASSTLIGRKMHSRLFITPSPNLTDEQVGIHRRACHTFSAAQRLHEQTLVSLWDGVYDTQNLTEPQTGTFGSELPSASEALAELDQEEALAELDRGIAEIADQAEPTKPTEQAEGNPRWPEYVVGREVQHVGTRERRILEESVVQASSAATALSISSKRSYPEAAGWLTTRAHVNIRKRPSIKVGGTPGES